MRSDRRSFVAACLTLPLLARAALAQDARESLVQAAARDWLKKNDAGDAAGALALSGDKLKKSVSPQDWAANMQKYRTPLGPVVQRTSLNTQFTRTFPGVPQGDYALANFRTAFANKTEGHETVTLERESDGQWRVIGYAIR